MVMLSWISSSHLRRSGRPFPTRAFYHGPQPGRAQYPLFDGRICWVRSSVKTCCTTASGIFGAATSTRDCEVYWPGKHRRPEIRPAAPAAPESESPSSGGAASPDNRPWLIRDFPSFSVPVPPAPTASLKISQAGLAAESNPIQSIRCAVVKSGCTGTADRTIRAVKARSLN